MGRPSEKRLAPRFVNSLLKFCGYSSKDLPFCQLGFNSPILA